MQTNNDPNSQVNEILAAALASGVEVNAQEAARWLIAMSQSEHAEAIAQNAEAGIFGHRVALLDFNADDLAYFRRLSKQIRTVAHPQVESAIAISGSSAQGAVQLFPGDCDFLSA